MKKPLVVAKHTVDSRHNISIIDAKRDLLYESIPLAIEKYQGILASDSNHATAHFEVAKLFLQKKELQKAVYHSQKAYSLNSDNIWFAHLYAQSLDISSQTTEASLVYERMLQKWNNDVELWYEVFRFLDKNEQYEKLNKYLDLFEKKYGYSEKIIINRYQSFIKQKKFKAIEKYLLTVLKADAKNEMANLILADYYLNTNKHDKASDIYDRILEINQNNDQALIGKIRIYLAKNDLNSTMKAAEKIISNSRIDISLKLGIITELSQTLEKVKGFNLKRFDNFIVSLYSQYPENPDILYFYGNLQFRTGNNKVAIETFIKALKIKPGNLQMWVLTLYILEKEKDYHRLVAIADSALLYYPNQKEMFMLRGFGHLQNNNLEKSYNDFLFARRLTGALDEDRNQILHYLAEVTYKMKRNDDAFKYYEEIIENDKNDIVALNNYAYYLSLENRDLNKALEMSAKTIKKEPKSSTYLDTYAYILFQLRRYPEALKYIELAILNGGTNSGVILEHYGDILFMNGQTDLAVNTWKEAKEKGDTSDMIDIKIEKREFIHETSTIE
jgi:tetratricopeptide (TPR) repeat protein